MPTQAATQQHLSTDKSQVLDSSVQGPIIDFSTTDTKSSLSEETGKAAKSSIAKDPQETKPEEEDDWEDVNMPHVSIAAIDNGLAFPFKHPDAWRAYPSMGLSAHGQIPFSDETVSKMLPYLDNTDFVRELGNDLKRIFETDAVLTKIDPSNHLTAPSIAVAETNSDGAATATLPGPSSPVSNLARRHTVSDEETDPKSWQNTFQQKVNTRSPFFSYCHIQFVGKLADVLVEAGHDVHVLMLNVDPNFANYTGTSKGVWFHINAANSRKSFGSNFPSIKEITQNVSLIFTNTNEFFEFPRPVSNKVKCIGGIVQSEAKPLRKNIKDILDNLLAV
uniref:Phosphatidylinositol 4-kinase type 2 n=1 Tax=Ditylenchus dipsaci TaxID=166011 RepID=A0A915EKF7_9BILA